MFWGQLWLTRVSEGRPVLCVRGWKLKQHKQIPCALSFLWLLFSVASRSAFLFHSHLCNLVTDENSESESDTEEKLKGEKEKKVPI